MLYFRVFLSEPGDWGTCTFYFETDDNLWPVRQIEVYENGTVLSYDEFHLMDEYGRLADQPFTLSLAGLDEFEIDAGEFEHVWDTYTPSNR